MRRALPWLLLASLVGCPESPGERPSEPTSDPAPAEEHLQAAESPEPESPGAESPVEDSAEEAESEQLGAVEPQAAVESPESAAPPVAGQTITIEAGNTRIGSRPGTEGRRARYEADLVAVELPSFSIDRLPYPNDPEQRPRTGVTRAQANALCEEQGKRLCTELEWERACKGDETDRLYPTGAQWTPELCAEDPLSCRSGADVLSMGINIAEWTASDGTRGLSPTGPTAVFRGARADGEPWQHRCASRRSAPADRQTRAIGFRCCQSAEAPTAAYPDEAPRARFRPLGKTSEELRPILAAMPELAPYAEDFRLTTLDQAHNAVARGNNNTFGWELADGGLRWSPVYGEEAWVFSGVGGGSALIAVLYPMPDGSLIHGGSFVLTGETTPIAIAHTPPEPNQLLWSAQWGRDGEGGSINYENGRAAILHR